MSRSLHIPRSRRRSGFGVIEVVIVVLIVAVLAAVAVPRYVVYQFRSKSAEAKTNLSALRVAEEAYFSEYESYLSVAPEPALIPGSISTDFDALASGFAPLGFETDGQVYFSYGVGVSSDGVGYTIDAGADIDEDGIVQFWGYTRADALGVRPAGQVGCDPTGLSERTIGPCDPTAGTSVF